MGCKNYYSVLVLVFVLTWGTTGLVAAPGFSGTVEEAMKAHSAGDLNGAILRLQTALPKAGSARQKSQVLLILSDFFREARLFKEMREAYQELLALDFPEFFQASNMGIAESYVLEGNPEKAIPFCARMFRANPDSETIEYAKSMARSSLSNPAGYLGRIFESWESGEEPIPLEEPPLPEKPPSRAVEPNPWEPVPSAPLPDRAEKSDSPRADEEKVWNRMRVEAGGWQSRIGGFANSTEMNLDLDSDMTGNPHFQLMLGLEYDLTFSDTETWQSKPTPPATPWSYAFPAPSWESARSFENNHSAPSKIPLSVAGSSGVIREDDARATARSYFRKPWEEA